MKTCETCDNYLEMRDGKGNPRGFCLHEGTQYGYVQPDHTCGEHKERGDD